MWNDLTSSVCEYRTQVNEVVKLTVLGPHDREFSLKRNYPIIKPYKVMIFHFNMIRDSWTPFNDFMLIQIRAGGAKILTQ